MSSSTYGKSGYGGVVVDNRKRNGALGGTLTLAVIGVSGYLIWKYALDSPASLTEAQDGLTNLTDKAGEQWEKWDMPGDWSDLSNFTDVLEGLSDELFAELYGGDPMLGDNTTYLWDDTFVDGGLTLTLQNALDDTWQTEFDMAVADWQASEALQLTAERVAVDYNCGRVDGVMVVCNANFGETGWVGINENSILGNVIVSSVAKMNEYYLRNADFDHRRFTMCHEIGHGEWVYFDGLLDVENRLLTSVVYIIHIVGPLLISKNYRNGLSQPLQDSVYPTRMKIPTMPTWETV
jgi:hypothetical protein